MRLRAGCATERIEVARGASMAGYVARTGAVSGVLHPLEVSAVVVSGESATAVLCVVDLLQMDDDLARTTRAAVAEAVGTSDDLVWVCATHTHAGPEPREVADRVTSAAVSAARSAVATARPVSVALHR